MHSGSVREIKDLVDSDETVEMSMPQSLYISNVKGCVLRVAGKCTKVSVMNAENSTIVVNKMISNLEAMRSRGCSFVVVEGSMVNLEECFECRVGLVPKSCEIRLCRSSCISLFRLGALAVEQGTREELERRFSTEPEVYLPEQIRVLVGEDGVKSEVCPRE